MVALVMLLVLTLIGVSSMNTAIVELKMAGSAQQQGVALNRADEMLRVGEDDVRNIVIDPGAFNFATAGDGYYVNTDNVNVMTTDWSGLNSIEAPNGTDEYVVEYTGAKTLLGGSEKEGSDIAGDTVHSFRITSRSEAGKGALRLVQSIYVTSAPP